MSQSDRSSGVEAEASEDDPNLKSGIRVQGVRGKKHGSFLSNAQVVFSFMYRHAGSHTFTGVPDKRDNNFIFSR